MFNGNMARQYTTAEEYRCRDDSSFLILTLPYKYIIPQCNVILNNATGTGSVTTGCLCCGEAWDEVSVNSLWCTPDGYCWLPSYFVYNVWLLKLELCISFGPAWRWVFQKSSQVWLVSFSYFNFVPFQFPLALQQSQRLLASQTFMNFEQLF